MDWPNDFINKILQGDVLDQLKNIPDKMIQAMITSPPYWGLRDYGIDGQLGLEPTPEKYVEKIVEIFKEIKRVLKKDGTAWLNLGDSYATRLEGHGEFKKWTSGGDPNPPASTVSNIKRDHKKIGVKYKNLIGIPWRVAFALQADDWYLRQDIIWHKNNPMPESVTDRCTKAHEYIFLLSKSAKYYFNAEAIKEPKIDPLDGVRRIKKSNQYNEIHPNIGKWTHNEKPDIKLNRNKRSVWTINTKPFKGAHFATFPPALPETCIKAASKEGDIILDPFFGSGTTGQVAQALDRKWIGIELNKEYIKIAENRLSQKPEIKKQENPNQLKLFNEI